MDSGRYEGCAGGPLYLQKKLSDSLDKVFAKKTAHNLDAVESKVFGIGAESYTVGSHEFYMGYAVKHQTL